MGPPYRRNVESRAPGPPVRLAGAGAAAMSSPKAHRPPVRLAGAAVVVLAIACAGLVGLRRVVVQGRSMEPTYRSGDRLLAIPSLRVRPGDVVLVADPRAPSRTLVKRVAFAGPHGVEVVGDAPGRSTDSRSFGVLRKRFWWRVIWRYAGVDGR